MGTWQVQDAKAKLSELLEDADRRGPQIITKHGKKRAVVLSFAEYESLLGNRPASFVSFLLNGPQVEGFEVERDRDTGREIEL